ncbi:glycosyltransferase [Sporosarcina thermotolerans]|uniref:glycosyltransferase n=1 Tax=Sporosarcina thermotolerans TaxID=633404 RepID=UPI0024BC3BBB|nr:glycosyltransferase [Sporosarcina thermotolerans]WHT48256.1 glycosyltransferase [Sporosarcina thermotolerans]
MKLAKESNLVTGKCELIPGSGVNITPFPLQPFPSNEEKIVFNYIGRVLKDKGIDDYIEAAKIIKKKYEYTEFNIIGFIEPTEMSYKKVLQELQEESIINYHGSQRDVKPFIKRSHCTIHPSTYGEGMSNVLLESASSGRPIITTDVSGCKETVEDGITGYVYKAGEMEDLVSKIELFIKLNNEERKKMGALGRSRVKNSFSRDIVVNAYVKEIDNLLKGSSSG